MISTSAGILGVLGTLWAVSALTAQAVIFYSTADPAFNTTPPAGDLVNSGWQYQGAWGAFLGTPIASHYFLTAQHIGGGVGERLTLAGHDYVATAYFDDPESDLRLWRVRQAFPEFAALYDQQDEVGRPAVVFGRGTQRGEPVYVSNEFGTKLCGWRWGAFDGLIRWGQNLVESFATDEANTGGDLLKLLFEADRDVNEATLSVGDSGGAVFIRDGTGWKLAAINYGVSGPYSTTDTGPGFEAALFDEGGLYVQLDNQWQRVPSLPFAKQPGAFFATRVSSRLEWIHQVLSLPGPDAGPVLVWSAQISGPYAEDPTALVNEDLKTITLPRPASSRFYQLQDEVPRTITSLVVAGDNLVLAYE